MTRYINDQTPLAAVILKPRAVVELLCPSRWNDESVSDRHVLLLNCLTDRQDASWYLYHRGTIYHNFHHEPSDQLFLFRRPLQYAILVKPPIK